LNVVSAEARVWSPTVACESGWRTKSRGALTATCTPAHTCGSIGPRLCTDPLPDVYGGPYWATSLWPAISLAAVVTKSTGSDLAHAWMVAEGTSGDERTAERISTTTRMPTVAMAISLTRSYGVIRIPR